MLARSRLPEAVPPPGVSCQSYRVTPVPKHLVTIKFTLRSTTLLWLNEADLALTLLSRFPPENRTPLSVRLTPIIRAPILIAHLLTGLRLRIILK